jgi:hypothetical protein
MSRIFIPSSISASYNKPLTRPPNGPSTVPSTPPIPPPLEDDDCVLPLGCVWAVCVVWAGGAAAGGGADADGCPCWSQGRVTKPIVTHQGGVAYAQQQFGVSLIVSSSIERGFGHGPARFRATMLPTGISLCK